MPELTDILKVGPRLGLFVNYEAAQSVTRGLVGDSSFAVLPQITKEYTFGLTFFFQLVRMNPVVWYCVC
jgi:alpha-1,3-glucosyltransferase